MTKFFSMFLSNYKDMYQLYHVESSEIVTAKVEFNQDKTHPQWVLY